MTQAHTQLKLALPLAALVLAAGSLAGCSTSPDPYVVSLENENAELRDAYDDLTAALEQSEAQSARLAAERDELAAELEAQPVAQTINVDTPGDYGFGQGSGVSVEGRVGEIVVTVAGDVLFSSGSVTLKKSAQTTLNDIARVLSSRYASNDIRIAGHSDSDPIRKSKWKTNERLSAERALAVEEYLATRGVSKDQMYIAGFGPAQPKGSKAQSRRVEIVIVQ